MTSMVSRVLESISSQPMVGASARRQRDHRLGNQDVEIGVLGERGGDARFGLVRDRQCVQLVQRADGVAGDGDAVRFGLIQHGDHAGHRRRRDLGQHAVFQRQIQHAARVVEGLHARIGLARVAQRAHAVASQVEGHRVGLFDLVAFPAKGEDARRGGVALGAQAVGQIVEARRPRRAGICRGAASAPAAPPCRRQRPPAATRRSPRGPARTSRRGR